LYGFFLENRVRILQLSDSVSILLHNPQEPLQFPSQEDPTYFFDLKNHLQNNPEYRTDRKEYYKKHPNWCLYRARDEFAREYVQTFHEDIKVFLRRFYPEISEDTYTEAAQAFCLKWKGYSNTYGLEFVERAISRCTIDSE
jgi:hypothetical protein